MTEARQLYTRLVARVRLALREGEPDHAIIAAVRSLHHAIGWTLGKTRSDVAKDCGVTPLHWDAMVYGRDAPDNYHQQHDEVTRRLAAHSGQACDVPEHEVHDRQQPVRTDYGRPREERHP